MWLARFFGDRTVEADDEPARFAPPESAKTRRPAARVHGNVSGAKVGSAPAKPGKSGFDPYNSGTFQRGNAWERVIRR